MNNLFLNNLDYGPVRRMTDRRRIKRIALAFLFIIIIIILTVVLTTKKVTAKREGNRIKKVTSIEIEKGDTLWSIASRYISDEYKDLNEYIEEIRMSNRLTSDTIHAGNYIIVPYYVDDSR